MVIRHNLYVVWGLAKQRNLEEVLIFTTCVLAGVMQIGITLQILIDITINVIGTSRTGN